MKCQVLFTSSQINDKSCRDIVKGIQFIGFTKIDHIPNQSLLICNLTMKFKMIKAKALLTKFMILESKGILSPFEKYSLTIACLHQTFSLR